MNHGSFSHYFRKFLGVLWSLSLSEHWGKSPQGTNALSTLTFRNRSDTGFSASPQCPREYSVMRLKLERLESRTLLAADIQVQHEPIHAAQPGDEVTQTIRVFSDSFDGQIQVSSSLSESTNSPGSTSVDVTARMIFVTSPRSLTSRMFFSGRTPGSGLTTLWSSF